MSKIEISESDDPVRVKVVVIGDMRVGKTSIAQRFTRNQFEERTMHTVGASYYIKSMEVEGRMVLFQIWDTAGQERFRSLVPMYLRDANIALLVYDITSKESFCSLDMWRAELLASAPENVTGAVVGNKSDLQSSREVDAKSGRSYAMKHKMLFTETSAKTGTNVEEIFYELGLRMSEPTLSGNIDTGSIQIPSQYLHNDVDDSHLHPKTSRSCCTN